MQDGTDVEFSHHRNGDSANSFQRLDVIGLEIEQLEIGELDGSDFLQNSSLMVVSCNSVYSLLTLSYSSFHSLMLAQIWVI